MTYKPFVSHEDFGAASNLGQNLNDAFTYDNAFGFSTIAFGLTVPAGGTVAFEGSFDGTTWVPITLRSIDTDEFQQTATVDEKFIGSIAGTRKVRVRTSVAGTAAGSVIGRATMDVAMLEGQEFFPPPHKFGHLPVHKDFSFTTAQTGTAIWTPAASRKYVVSDLSMIATGLIGAEVTIFDQSDATGNRLFNGILDPSTNNPLIVSLALRVPFVSAAINNVLKITTTANLNIGGVVHGYEIR